MNTNEIMKSVSDEMKANGANNDEIAKVEVAIQYIGNEKFRQYVNDYVFKATYKN